MTIKKEVVRYDHNPFIRDMVIPIKGKKIQLSVMGKDNNILVNQDTGEIKGTHISTFKKVDGAQFVKLFAQNIALTFNLNSAGIKAFTVLMWVLKDKGIERDLVALDKYSLEDFVAAHNENDPPIKLGQGTFWKGLAELEMAQIVAKSVRQGWYYINPNFVFNGDRIAFSTIIERCDSVNEKQIDLPM